MNRVTLLLAAAIIAFASGCVIAQPPPELNADAFRAHFSDEERCSTFIEKLVLPAAKNMASLRSVHEMRLWLAAHPKDPFSNLVAKVQSVTNEYGVMYPERESDQIKAAKQLYIALREMHGFSESGCGADVREVVTSTLYEGIGCTHSLVIEELDKDGIRGISEQRWILLTAIIAGKLPSKWN